MTRYDVLEPPPLSAKRYVCRSVLAAGVLLGLWAIVLLTDWSGSGLIVLSGWAVVLGFPVLVLVSLFALVPLPGWKQRLLGFLCWLLLWPLAYALGISMFFWIAGSS